MNIKKISIIGILIALSMIFSYVETIIIILPSVPGVKIGLANICVLFCLYNFSYKDTLFVLVLRILLVGFVFTSLSMMLYSLAGGITAFLIMAFLYKLNKFSVIAISTAGGVSHNLGQVILAAIVLETKAVISYLPVLIIFGAISGFLMGIITKEILFRTEGLNLK